MKEISERKYYKDEQGIALATKLIDVCEYGQNPEADIITKKVVRLSLQVVIAELCLGNEISGEGNAQIGVDVDHKKYNGDRKPYTVTAFKDNLVKAISELADFSTQCSLDSNMEEFEIANNAIKDVYDELEGDFFQFAGIINAKFDKLDSTK